MEDFEQAINGLREAVASLKEAKQSELNLLEQMKSMTDLISEMHRIGTGVRSKSPLQVSLSRVAKELWTKWNTYP